MASLWGIAKGLQIPIDSNIRKIEDIPYTISFVIRKRIQLDSFYELPKEKRPPDSLIWESYPEELDEWLDSVLSGKHKPIVELEINEDEIG